MSKRKPFVLKLTSVVRPSAQPLSLPRERIGCFYLSLAERLTVNAPTVLLRYPRDPQTSRVFAMQCGVSHCIRLRARLLENVKYADAAHPPIIGAFRKFRSRSAGWRVAKRRQQSPAAGTALPTSCSALGIRGRS